MAGRSSFTGWLYYAVDLFSTGCTPNPSPHTHVANRTTTLSNKLDWNPGNCIWGDEYGEDFFANGDGQFIYPGVDGPIPTTRLFMIREGIQDAEMFRMIPQETANEIIEKVVKSATDHDNDVVKVEQARIEAGNWIQENLKR